MTFKKLLSSPACKELCLNNKKSNRMKINIFANCILSESSHKRPPIVGLTYVKFHNRVDSPLPAAGAWGEAGLRNDWLLRGTGYLLGGMECSLIRWLHNSITMLNTTESYGFKWVNWISINLLKERVESEVVNKTVTTKRKGKP